MRTAPLTALCVAFLVGSVSAIEPPAPQTELDHIVGRVNKQIITLGDVHQARTLSLVTDTTSDDAVQRELEERLLVLGDMTKAAPVTITDVDVATERGVWEARVGGRDRAAALLSEAGMSDVALQIWMKDNARIHAYLTRQFAVTPDSDRARVTSEWMTRLRQRAGLK